MILQVGLFLKSLIVQTEHSFFSLKRVLVIDIKISPKVPFQKLLSLQSIANPKMLLIIVDAHWLGGLRRPFWDQGWDIFVLKYHDETTTPVILVDYWKWQVWQPLGSAWWGFVACWTCVAEGYLSEAKVEGDKSSWKICPQRRIHKYPGYFWILDSRSWAQMIPIFSP